MKTTERSTKYVTIKDPQDRPSQIVTKGIAQNLEEAWLGPDGTQAREKRLRYDRKKQVIQDSIAVAFLLLLLGFLTVLLIWFARTVL